MLDLKISWTLKAGRSLDGRLADSRGGKGFRDALTRDFVVASCVTA